MIRPEYYRLAFNRSDIKLEADLGNDRYYIRVMGSKIQSDTELPIIGFVICAIEITRMNMVHLLTEDFENLKTIGVVVQFNQAFNMAVSRQMSMLKSESLAAYLTDQ